jgi:Oxidoreductase family, NAD-binding Rossmann fold
VSAQGTGTRWGILGTANIARAQFLPGLREAGGVAAAVAGRDAGRAERYARDNGIERAIGGYQNLIDDPDIDALYIPLPNSLHAEWTLRALAGPSSETVGCTAVRVLPRQGPAPLEYVIGQRAGNVTR